MIRLQVKALLFPGIDFCLRKRLKLARRYLRRGAIKTLDVGCGNGAFSFLCYQLGNSITGIDIDEDKIRRCIEYREYKRMPKNKIEFMITNIGDFLKLDGSFEQILCFETLEHIMDDRHVIEIFSKLLKPGGLVHLGVPNLNCPSYYGEKISDFENGSHVRKGYTYLMIENILKEFNMLVIKRSGYGGFFTRVATILSRRLQNGSLLNKLSGSIKESVNILIFLILNPFTYLDKFLKSEPMSIYIMAQKAML